MIAHRYVALWPILLDRSWRRDLRQEIVITRIVVNQRHFAGEDSAAFGPESMGDKRVQRQTLAWLKRDAIARPKVQRLDVLERSKPLFERRAAAVDLEQLDD